MECIDLQKKYGLKVLLLCCIKCDVTTLYCTKSTFLLGTSVLDIMQCMKYLICHGFSGREMI